MVYKQVYFLMEIIYLELGSYNSGISGINYIE